MSNHSINFSAIPRPFNQALEAIKNALSATDLKPGGYYRLIQWTQDDSDNEIVAVQRGLSRNHLPEIKEDPESFNAVTFVVWSETTELMLNLRRHDGWIQFSLVALEDLLSTRGEPWVTSTMSAFLATLKLDAAIVCDEEDEEEVERRMRAGEPLSALILSRVRGKDPLPVPLLALVKAELCDGTIWEQAAAQGVRGGITPRDYALFSTV